MILNVSSRADIVTYYPDWLAERFRDGTVYARNPLFPNKVSSYILRPDKVDAVVFCSKNYQPFFPHLHKISENYNTYFQYTITAYEKEIEPNIPDLETSVKTLRELSEYVGKMRVAWRYDPVFLTDTYTCERHIETFSWLAERIAPYASCCIFSFIELHAALQHNLPELIPIAKEEKERLAKAFAAISQRNGIRLQTCSLRDAFPQYGIAQSGCVTLEVLGKANNCMFREARHRGNRRGCLCIESRDIGWYDSCPGLCRYCYANHSAAAVEENRRRHDPHSPLLIGALQKEDTLLEGVQTSMLKNPGGQISLFDL